MQGLIKAVKLILSGSRIYIRRVQIVLVCFQSFSLYIMSLAEVFKARLCCTECAGILNCRGGFTTGEESSTL